MDTNQRKEMERSMNKLGRQIKGIKGDIEILREMRDDNTRMAKRVERVNQEDCTRFTELASYYGEKLKSKEQALRDVECALAWERDLYARRVMLA